jgi:hypothetical protein
MNPEPPDPGPPTHQVQLAVKLANGHTKIIAFPVPEVPIPKNGYAVRPEGPTRIVLLCPGHDQKGNPMPTIHGLDFKTASRILGELALSIALIQPPPKSPESIPE